MNIIVKNAFSLSPFFRVYGSAFYFKMHGYSGKVDRLLNFDPLEALRKNSMLLDAFEGMSDLIEKGKKSSFWNEIRRN